MTFTRLAQPWSFHKTLFASDRFEDFLNFRSRTENLDLAARAPPL